MGRKTAKYDISYDNDCDDWEYYQEEEEEDYEEEDAVGNNENSPSVHPITDVDELLQKKPQAKIVMPKYNKTPLTISGLQQRYRARQESDDVFKLLGNDECSHIAQFLLLSEISSFSCVTKYLDKVLSCNLFYYYNGEVNNNNNGNNILPCVRELQPLIKDFYDRNHFISSDDDNSNNSESHPPKGILRKYALESDVYKHKYTSRSAFRLVHYVNPVDADNLFIHHEALSYTTKSCEIAVRKHRITKKIKLPGCREMSSSAYGNTMDGRLFLCAALTTSSTKETKSCSNDVLSLIQLPTATVKTTEDSFSPNLLWQSTISVPTRKTYGNAKVCFDSSANNDLSSILVNSNHCCVYDTSSGKEIWSTKDLVWDCMLHNNLVFAEEHASTHNIIKIYDVREKEGHLTTCKTPGFTSAMTVYGERLWYGYFNSLLYTSAFLSSSGTSNRKFPLEIHSKVKGRWKENSRMRENALFACCDNYLFTAFEKTINRFDVRNLSEPCESFDTHGNVRSIQVDNTKIVYSCATTDTYITDNIHILPLGWGRQTRNNSIYYSYRYLDYCRPDIGEFHFRGNLLALSNSYKVKGRMPRDVGEIRVVDIQHKDKEETRVQHKSFSKKVPKSYTEVVKQYYREKAEENEEQARAAAAAAAAKEQNTTLPPEVEAVLERSDTIEKRKEKKKKSQLEQKSKKKAASKQMKSSQSYKRS